MKEKKIPLTIAQTEQILTQQSVKVRYNILTHEIEFEGTNLPHEHAAEMFSTIVFSALRAMDCYSGVTLPAVENYLAVLAYNNRRNPLKETLILTPWDDIDRLGDLYNIMRLKETDALSRALVKKWLMQTIALSCFNERIEPFGAEGVLVLCGAQGIGKTTLVSKLGINNRLCKLGVNIDPHNKDDVLQATSAFICELGELESTMKRDVAALKAFLTAHTDEVRKPYARAASRERRRTSFAATCNSRDFLNDPTGNRRFFTIDCPEPFDLAALAKLDIYQLWAQIFHDVLYAADPSKCFRLTRDEARQLAERNGAHTKTIPAEQEVRDILGDAAENPSKYDWKMLTVTDWAGYYLCLKKYSSQQIGRALEQCGVENEIVYKGKTRVKYRRVPVYKKRDNFS